MNKEDKELIKKTEYLLDNELQFQIVFKELRAYKKLLEKHYGKDCHTLFYYLNKSIDFLCETHDLIQEVECKK